MMAVTTPANAPRPEPAISSHLPPISCQWFFRLGSTQWPVRAAARPAVPGCDPGRRTVASSIRAAKLSDRFRPGSTIVAAAGKEAHRIAARPTGVAAVQPLVADAERLTLALDHTPTER
jgi:hypothetical protein